VHLLHRGLPDRVQGLLATTLEVGKLACGGVDVDDRFTSGFYGGLPGVLTNTGHKK
jgi:hypothetical protein